MFQVAELKNELENEREEKMIQSNKAAIKSDEIREVRQSLGKSLLAVEEDANNLRSMLGKSLRKIDRYTDAIRRNGASLSADTDGSTVDAKIDNTSDDARYVRSSKRRTRSAAHVNVKERDKFLDAPSPARTAPSQIIVNNSDFHRDDSEHISPLRRYRRERQSVNYIKNTTQ